MSDNMDCPLTYLGIQLEEIGGELRFGFKESGNIIYVDDDNNAGSKLLHLLQGDYEFKGGPGVGHKGARFLIGDEPVKMRISINDIQAILLLPDRAEQIVADISRRESDEMPDWRAAQSLFEDDPRAWFNTLHTLGRDKSQDPLVNADKTVLAADIAQSLASILDMDPTTIKVEHADPIEVVLSDRAFHIELSGDPRTVLPAIANAFQQTVRALGATVNVSKDIAMLADGMIVHNVLAMLEGFQPDSPGQQ